MAMARQYAPYLASVCTMASSLRAKYRSMIPESSKSSASNLSDEFYAPALRRAPDFFQYSMEFAF